PMQLRWRPGPRSGTTGVEKTEGTSWPQLDRGCSLSTLAARPVFRHTNASGSRYDSGSRPEGQTLGQGPKRAVRRGHALGETPGARGGFPPLSEGQTLGPARATDGTCPDEPCQSGQLSDISATRRRPRPAPPLASRAWRDR